MPLVRLKSIPPLEEYLFNQQLKGIYRDIVRAVYKNHERQELMNHIRPEFKPRGPLLMSQRKYMLNTGIGQINQMLPMMGLSKQFAPFE